MWVRVGARVGFGRVSQGSAFVRVALKDPSPRIPHYKKSSKVRQESFINASLFVEIRPRVGCCAYVLRVFSSSGHLPTSHLCHVIDGAGVCFIGIFL